MKISNSVLKLGKLSYFITNSFLVTLFHLSFFAGGTAEVLGFRAL